MKTPSLTDRIILIVALAAVGAVLIYIPPRILDQYDKIKGLGAPWTYLYFGLVGCGAAIMLGLAGMGIYTIWKNTREKRQQNERRIKNPSELSAGEKQQEMLANLAAVDELQRETELQPDLKRELIDRQNKFQEKQAAQRLEIVAFGTISSGKSSLMNALAGRDVFQTDPRGGTTTQRQQIPWPGDDQVLLVDTPGLGEIDGQERLAVAAESARDADLVLLVVDGPLRDSEFNLLRKLGDMEKRVIVCLNKEDWYAADDQPKLIGQLSEQLRGIVQPEHIVAVRASASQRSRVHVLVDGNETESQVTVPPEIAPLAEQMLKIVRRDGRELLLANLLLQSRGLVEHAKAKVRATLDARAWEIVDRYTWAAGAAAAVSPMALDVLIGSGLTIKMVLDLGKIYRQPIDLDIATNLAAQLGKVFITVVGVGAAAPAIASVIGSLLKSVPIAGTIAGGAIQGFTQAFVTRWVGSVFINYFQTEMQQQPTGLANVARQEWQKLTTPTELFKFVQTAREKLKGK
ncbi:GTP-binding protein [Anatilimnocola floriformis]|uniref:GTP-binding protein n=1 Tax=Anatilimnocola floriformis TaxID=2948575 RepID=UPI0020C4B88D|nr:GTP-binding protein [Anatilimnocola floriformis]